MQRPVGSAAYPGVLALVLFGGMSVILVMDDYSVFESVAWSFALGATFGTVTYWSMRRRPTRTLGEELRDAALAVGPLVLVTILLRALGAEPMVAFATAVFVAGFVYPDSLIRRAIRRD